MAGGNLASNKKSMGNVMNWKAAIAAGFCARDYSYEPDDIPLGMTEAILVFKTWANRAYTINCYFQSLLNGQRFCIVVYRRNSDKTYAPEGCENDFAECSTQTVYRITIEKDGKSIPKLRDAKEIVY